jgi:glycosyltransferase involved in cell wall biosynthesis
MKILFLATMPAIEASTRFRVLQYFAALRSAGHEPLLSPFFQETPGGTASRVARGLLARAHDLWTASDYDLVVIHRELLPHAWNHAVRLLDGRVPILYDFDDAVFLASQAGWRGRIAAPDSTRSLVDAARLVFAGNDYLAEYARRSHARVEIVPTVVDTTVYRPLEGVRNDLPLIGWIGSPSTAAYLEPIVPILDDLARSFPFRLRIVGVDRPIRLDRVEVESPPWHADHEEEFFRDLDIGLYPLSDDKWALGKCGLKAIQYMACGVASVSSPVGVVREIVRPGIDGLWAEHGNGWRDALAWLLGAPEKRAMLGASGRVRACEHYSLSVTTPRVLSAFERTISS